LSREERTLGELLGVAVGDYSIIKKRLSEFNNKTSLRAVIPVLQPEQFGPLAA
jgi:hypothetical protein